MCHDRHTKCSSVLDPSVKSVQSVLLGFPSFPFGLFFSGFGHQDETFWSVMLTFFAKPRLYGRNMDSRRFSRILPFRQSWSKLVKAGQGKNFFSSRLSPILRTRFSQFLVMRTSLIC